MTSSDLLRGRSAGLLLALLLALGSGPAPAAEPPPAPAAAAEATIKEAPKDPGAAKIWPRLYTNQEMLEEAAKTPVVDTKDPLAVFDYVMKSLPAQVTVYPTENYFYFWFWHGHVKWAGNIRLDPQERDRGLVNFAYFEDYTDWAVEADVIHRLLGPDEGVTVEKLDALVYRVGFRGTSVVFRLNDLSRAAPPAGFLRPQEVLIGPVADESGVRFFLVWNKEAKLFHYLVDETAAPTEAWRASRVSPRILVGKRTGFAVFRDRYQDRKILIGVFAGNAAVNNYYDGPFDQLPDNFMTGETLREAILTLAPELKGKIDRFGNSPDGRERYLVGPYMQWRSEDDLAVVSRCTTDKKIKGELYYACFVMEN